MFSPLKFMVIFVAIAGSSVKRPTEKPTKYDIPSFKPPYYYPQYYGPMFCIPAKYLTSRTLCSLVTCHTTNCIRTIPADPGQLRCCASCDPNPYMGSAAIQKNIDGAPYDINY